MSDTQHKLEESKYFLDRTRENINSRKYFSFNLSAFLSSTRSVTWVMQKEFRHCNGFDKWYEDERTQMKKDPQCKFIVDKRDVTVHERTIMPNKKVSVNIKEKKIMVNESVNVKVIRNGNVISESTSIPRHSIEIPDINEKEKEYSISRFFMEYPDDDLLKVCEQYLGKLGELVEECIKLFSPK
jgi:hypothetical protein